MGQCFTLSVFKDIRSAGTKTRPISQTVLGCPPEFHSWSISAFLQAAILMQVSECTLPDTKTFSSKMWGMFCGAFDH